MKKSRALLGFSSADAVGAMDFKCDANVLSLQVSAAVLEQFLQQWLGCNGSTQGMFLHIETSRPNRFVTGSHFQILVS